MMPKGKGMARVIFAMGYQSVWIAGPAYVIAYVLLDLATYVYPFRGVAIVPWAPQTGLTFAVLLVIGPRILPFAIAAPIVADMIVRGQGLPLPTMLLAGLLVGGVYTAATTTLMKPRFQFDAALNKQRDVLLLMAFAVVSCGLVALLYAALLTASSVVKPDDFMKAMMRRWIGDMIGVAVGTPFLLLPLAYPRLLRPTLEGMLQALTIIAALYIAFGFKELPHYRLFNVTFLPIIWIAMRHGLEGAAWALMLTQIGLVIALVLTGDTPSSATAFQALMLVLTVTGLTIGAVVSERRRVEKQLRSNQESISHIFRLGSIGELSTAIAHEINQPLTAISNYTRLVQRYLATGVGDRSVAAEAATKAVAQVERTAAVVKSLRELIRLGRGELAPHSLHELFSEVNEIVEARALPGDIEVSINTPRGLPPVMADRLQIEQVMLNLISNAVEAIEHGKTPAGRVSIDAQEDGPDFVRISVRDNGPGFPKGFNIEPVLPLSSSKPGGLGVGLVLSRSIVEAHGGKLFIDSRERGAVVSFTLPKANTGGRV